MNGIQENDVEGNTPVLDDMCRVKITCEECCGWKYMSNVSHVANNMHQGWSTIYVSHATYDGPQENIQPPLLGHNSAD